MAIAGLDLLLERSRGFLGLRHARIAGELGQLLDAVARALALEHLDRNGFSLPIYGSRQAQNARQVEDFVDLQSLLLGSLPVALAPELRDLLRTLDVTVQQPRLLEQVPGVRAMARGDDDRRRRERVRELDRGAEVRNFRGRSSSPRSRSIQSPARA